MLRVGSTGDWIGTFIGHKGCVWSAALNADATRAITGSADYTATLWNAETGEALASLEHQHIVRAVDLSPSGARAATGGRRRTLRVAAIDRDEFSVSWMCPDAHEDSIRRVLFAGPSDSSLLLSAGGKSVRLWDVRQAADAGAVRELKCSASVNDISLTGTSLLVSHGESVLFSDAESLAAGREFAYPFAVHSAALHPSGERFLAGGANFAAMVCDAKTGDALEVHKGHHGPVHCIRYAPDLATYASSSEDGTIRLWQTEIRNYGLWVVSDESEKAESEEREEANE